MIGSIRLVTTDGKPVPVEDLTELSLTGQGVFDKFLQLQRIHLQREFDDRRIQGKEYSEVYLKTYIASLEQAIAFLLAKEKQAYELDLLAEEANKVRKDIEMLDVKIDQEKYILKFKLPKEIELMDAQIRKIDADIRLTEEQIKIAKLELQLKEKDLILKEKEIALKEKELILKEKEIAIAEAQLELMRAKIKTEKAQTDGSYIGSGSVLGKQNAVLDAQIQGYKRDAEQKAAQLMLQTWITRMNNDAAFAYEANMLQDKFIGRSVQKLFQGINISTTGFDENATPPDPATP